MVGVTSVRFKMAMLTLGVGTRMALPVSFAGQFRQRLGDGLGGAGFGNHHVERRAAMPRRSAL